MSAADAMLNQVSLLVAALPGVTVLERGMDGQKAVLKVSVLGVVPAHHVQRICEAANVQLEPPLRSKDSAPGADTPRFSSLTASTEQFDAIRFGDLQMLGIHLVCHLHRIGAMSADSANGFLQRWGAGGLAPAIPFKPNQHQADD